MSFVASEADGTTLLQVSRVDGSDAHTLLRYPCADLPESDVHWFPDGRSLIVDFACNSQY